VAWYIHSTPSASKEGKHEEEGRGGSGLVPVYEKLDTFTVNLEGGDEHYLQAEISLKLAEADVGEQIKARMPEIRDRVVRILSAKNPDALTSVAGKDALAKELLENLNKLLGAGEGKKGVQAVLFTSFIIQ
jgi:flagellar FliL protein